MGVHFKPGGAFPFLGLPAGELADTHVDLEALWGSFANRLRERICEGRDRRRAILYVGAGPRTSITRSYGTPLCRFNRARGL